MRADGRASGWEGTGGGRDGRVGGRARSTAAHVSLQGAGGRPVVICDGDRILCGAFIMLASGFDLRAGDKVMAGCFH